MWLNRCKIDCEGLDSFRRCMKWIVISINQNLRNLFWVMQYARFTTYSSAMSFIGDCSHWYEKRCASVQHRHKRQCDGFCRSFIERCELFNRDVAHYTAQSSDVHRVLPNGIQLCSYRKMYLCRPQHCHTLQFHSRRRCREVPKHMHTVINRSVRWCSTLKDCIGFAFNTVDAWLILQGRAFMKTVPWVSINCQRWTWSILKGVYRYWVVVLGIMKGLLENHDESAFSLWLNELRRTLYLYNMW